MPRDPLSPPDFREPLPESMENFANAMFVASRYGMNGDPEASNFRRMEMRRLLWEFCARHRAEVMEEAAKVCEGIPLVYHHYIATATKVVEECAAALRASAAGKGGKP